MINENGQKVYFYQICDYEESFWVYSIHQYSKEQFKAMVEPIHEKFRNDVDEHQKKSILLYNGMKNGDITEEQYEQEIDYIDDNESPYCNKENSLRKILVEKYEMHILEHEAESFCSSSAW